MGMDAQCHDMTSLPEGKNPIPTEQEAGQAPGPFWMGAESQLNSDLKLNLEDSYKLIPLTLLMNLIKY